MDSLDVLVVEDNQADPEIIRRCLNQLERTVDIRHRKTVRGATTLLEDADFDLVLVDHGLPRKSGLEFLGEFQNRDSYLPVIMISSEGDESLLSHSLRLGADDYISKKNLSPGVLNHSIEHVLEKARRQFERDLKVLEFEYVENSTLDLLTGLPNRDALLDRLGTDLRCYENGSSKKVSLLLLDVDGFRRVNDQRGFLAGDELLRRMATTLSARVDEEEFLGRYGSDEFCVLSPIDRRPEASEKARLIQGDLRELFDRWTDEQNLNVSLSVSFGISICVSRTDDPVHHFNRVKRALGRSKATKNWSALDVNGVIS